MLNTLSFLVRISGTPTAKDIPSSSPSERFPSSARRLSTPSSHVHPFKNEAKTVLTVNISVGISVTIVLLAVVVAICFIVHRANRNRDSAKNVGINDPSWPNNETASGTFLDKLVPQNHETTKRQNGGR